MYLFCCRWGFFPSPHPHLYFIWQSTDFIKQCQPNIGHPLLLSLNWLPSFDKFWWTRSPVSSDERVTLRDQNDKHIKYERWQLLLEITTSPIFISARWQGREPKRERVMLEFTLQNVFCSFSCRDLNYLSSMLSLIWKQVVAKSPLSSGTEPNN